MSSQITPMKSLLGSLIEDFPTEILLSIFTYIYSDSHSRDRRNLVLFPYAISAVCQRWRDIVESVPAFWTRVVACVDEPPTPVSRVRKQLQLSKDRNLEIIVHRRPDTYLQDDVGEHDRCRVVIDLLMPHLYRCCSILFDVIDTSSLPSNSRDFRGPALSLWRLVLKALFDDGKDSGNRSLMSSPTSEENALRCPKLSSIEVDGRNFAHACLDMPSWRSSLCIVPGNYRHMELSDFTPVSSKDHQFTVDNFLAFMEALPSGYSLTLNAVEFQYTNLQQLNVAASYVLSPSYVELISLSAGFMTALFDRANYGVIDELYIESCELTFGGVVPSAGSLILQEISVEEDIAEFLYDWDGHCLNIDRCPGFNDRVLLLFDGAWADNILSLDIQDCEGFSARGLMEMAKTIYDASQALPVDGRGLLQLTVSGWGPSAPSDEETKWFERHLDVFRWDAKERPTLVDGVET